MQVFDDSCFVEVPSEGGFITRGPGVNTDITEKGSYPLYISDY